MSNVQCVGNKAGVFGMNVFCFGGSSLNDAVLECVGSGWGGARALPLPGIAAAADF